MTFWLRGCPASRPLTSWLGGFVASRLSSGFPTSWLRPRPNPYVITMLAVREGCAMLCRSFTCKWGEGSAFATTLHPAAFFRASMVAVQKFCHHQKCMVLRIMLFAHGKGCGPQTPARPASHILRVFVLTTHTSTPCNHIHHLLCTPPEQVDLPAYPTAVIQY